MNATLNLGFFLLLGGPPGAKSCKVDIGAPVIPNCWHTKQPCLVLTPPANIDPGFSFAVNDIHYRAVLKKGRYSFISTDDKSFITPEGFTVANCFADLKVKRTAIISRRGWAKFYRLPSGWGCAFDFKTEVIESSKILYFFKEAN